MDKYYKYSDCDINVHYSRDEQPKKESFKLHTHESYEIYCLLDGSGNFKVEGNTYPLQNGDILILRPAESHYIDIDLSSPYTRMAINFNEDLFEKFDNSHKLLTPFTNREYGQLNLYRAKDFKNTNYKIFVNNICTPTENRKLQIISNLLPLLNEILIAFEGKSKEEQDDSTVNKITRYINSKITEEISLDEICNEFYISKPQLCRIFKSATGSTVWEYITAKRLIAAQSLIKAGQAPTKIYSDCGFGDYSAFYRAYKKKFGISPNKNQSSY